MRTGEAVPAVTCITVGLVLLLLPLARAFVSPRGGAAGGGLARVLAAQRAHCSTTRQPVPLRAAAAPDMASQTSRVVIVPGNGELNLHLHILR